GRWLLYWGSGFGPIKVQELAADGLSFAAGSSPTTLVEANCFYDYSCLVEGAWVTYKEPYYYLYYSGDSCCEPVNYAVLVARSESPTGPFMTLEQSTDEPDSVILEKDVDWIGPGHNSLVTDASGHEWIVYHAVDVDHFFLDTDDPAERFVRRPMLIEPVEYVDGWPRIGDGTPSGAPSPASPQP
ncbi:MAG: glycoside hydrolase family 43 protein, partial [Candidatus Limnocylindrales bacterium]